MKDPSFVKHFKSRRHAIQAVQFIVIAREAGLSNKSILEMFLFRNLFDPEYLIGKTESQLEWKLKNMCRDIGQVNLDDLSSEFHDFKLFFERKKRG